MELPDIYIVHVRVRFIIPDTVGYKVPGGIDSDFR